MGWPGKSDGEGGLFILLVCFFSLALIPGAPSLNGFALMNNNNASSLPIFWFQKLGREVSRILLLSNSLEFAIALTYSIYGCIGLVSASLPLAYTILGYGRVLWTKIKQSREIGKDYFTYDDKGELTP